MGASTIYNYKADLKFFPFFSYPPPTGTTRSRSRSREELAYFGQEPKYIKVRCIPYP